MCIEQNTQNPILVSGPTAEAEAVPLMEGVFCHSNPSTEGVFSHSVPSMEAVFCHSVTPAQVPSMEAVFCHSNPCLSRKQDLK